MIFSGFGMKDIKMSDDSIKTHFTKFEKTRRKGHRLITFDLRQKINQKRKQMIDGEDKPMKEKKIHKKCKSQKYILKKFTQKKINIPCKFGDACKFKSNCWFLHHPI